MVNDSENQKPKSIKDCRQSENMKKKMERWNGSLYKARLVSQVFSQRPEIDFDETYSLVVDVTIFWYFIRLLVHE